MDVSKLPWRFVEGQTSQIVDAVGSRVCDDFARPPHETDMQFMVEACNAHARLVADNARLTAELETVRRAANQCIDAALMHSDKMSVRDGFALAAMQGAAASNTIYTSTSAASEDAYAMADAMLAERAK
jgi:hypothetical protein